MKIYALLLGLILPFASFAQSNYKSGYIITNNGDTIRGQVNLQEWATNPEYVDLKVQETVKRYKPADVAGFYVEPEFKYISYTGRISKNHNQFPDVDKERDTTTQLATVFLKELVNGSRLSLYTLSDRLKTSYFYQEANGALVELNYYQYYYRAPGADSESTKSVLKDERFYVQQLLNLSRLHPEWGNYTISDFEKLGYRQNDLITVTRKINKQTKANKPKGKNTQLYAGVGLVIANTKFKTEGDVAFNDASSKPGFKAAVGINVFANPITQKLVFRAELAAEFTTAEASRQKANAANELVTQVYQIKRNSFSLSPQIIYNFYNADNLKVHFGGGFGFSYNTYPKNGVAGGGSIAGGAYYPTYLLNKFIVAFPVQVGLQINKRVEGAISYTTPHRINTEQITSVKSSSLGFTVRYMFN